MLCDHAPRVPLVGSRPQAGVPFVQKPLQTSAYPHSASRFYTVYRQVCVGPVDPSFGALSGRLKFTGRRHKFNKDSLSSRMSRISFGGRGVHSPCVNTSFMW